MSWTKRALIEEAYGELALAGYVFDLSAEEMQRGLRYLDTQMAEWSARGIHIGYAAGVSPTSTDLDNDSGVPLYAVSPVYTNLAKRLAAGLGKMLTPQTLEAARDGMELLLRQAAFPSEQQLPSTLPRGAGNKQWRTDRPFFAPPDKSPLQVADDGGLQLGS